MKHLAPLAVAVALAGCALVDDRSYGSWLDHVGERKVARYPFTDQERAALQAKAAQLEARADGVRLQLAGEKDRVKRIAYMHELEDIGGDLQPVQQALREGGTQRRRYAPPSNYTQAGGQ